MPDREGPTWGPPGIVARDLKAAGLNVYTAPIANGGGAPPAPCTGGQATPPQSAVIDSNGDVNANGAALAGFIAFLRDNYGVTSVQLVGHSDGGLWSRSALTQDGAYGGVAIPSLTTLGTPHTGSFAADLGVYLNNGQCDTTGWIQDVCEVFQSLLDKVLAGIGPVAVEQLTSGFLATWNPQQRIGGCPVTGYAGTYEDFSYLPFTYLNPSDGVVGQASALNTAASGLTGPIPAAPIPGFKSGGTLPRRPQRVAELPQRRQRAQLAAAGHRAAAAAPGLGPGGPAVHVGHGCGGERASPAARLAGPAAPRRLGEHGPPRRAARDGHRRRRGHRRSPRPGVLPRPAAARCPAVRRPPHPAHRHRPLLAATACRGRPHAARLGPQRCPRPDPGDRPARPASPSAAARPGPLRLEVRRGTRWRALRLDRRGRATLPGRADTVAVRITGGRRGATRVQGTTLLSLAS